MCFCDKIKLELSYNIVYTNSFGFVLYSPFNNPIKNADPYYARLLHKIEGLSLLDGTQTTKEFELTYAI